MNGRRGAWLVLALVAGPVLAGPIEGGLQVTVEDGTSHNRLQGASVQLGAGGPMGFTDQNGVCVISPVAAGNYPMTVVKDQRYHVYESIVAVHAPPPPGPTAVLVELERVVPDLKMTIVAPTGGTVGNTTTVIYRLHFQDMAFTPVKLYLWCWNPEAGRSRLIYETTDLDVNQIPPSEIVADEWDVPDRTMTLRKSWDTTELYNGTHEIRIAAEFTNPWGAPIVLGTPPDTVPSPGVDGGGGTTTDVQNVWIDEVTTDSDSADYFVYDPEAAVGHQAPTVTFTIVDNGRVQTDETPPRPFRYDWEVRLGGGDGLVIAAGECASLPASPVTTAVDTTGLSHGAYTFDVHVTERPVGDHDDSYWYRQPYRLRAGEFVPGVGGPNPQVWFEAPDRVAWRYRLDDSRAAAAVRLKLLDQNLNELAVADGLPTTTGTIHEGAMEILEPARGGPFVAVLAAEDSHGVDGDPSYRVYGSNRRMLATVDEARLWEAHGYSLFGGLLDSFTDNVLPLSGGTFYVPRTDLTDDPATALDWARQAAVLQSVGHGLGTVADWPDDPSPIGASGGYIRSSCGTWWATAKYPDTAVGAVMLGTGAFQSCRVLVLAGCFTANTHPAAGNLLAAAAMEGAGAAVGFGSAITTGDPAADWQYKFWRLMAGWDDAGPSTVEQACIGAADYVKQRDLWNHRSWGFSNWQIQGSPATMIVSAACD